MADVIITPNMNLPNPVPGKDNGPDYANNLEQSLNIVDAHNHTPGNGVQIPTSGLNINSNMPFNNFQATDVQAILFSAQSSLASLLSLYTIGNDLYFNDGASNVVQITSGGTVNATSSGISSGSATASFSSSILVVNAAANTPANIQVGSILLGNNIANSKFLTLSPPNAMAANYNLVLPSLPVSQSFMTLDSSGNMATPVVYPLVAAGIANATITATQISASAGIAGSQLSASAGIVGTQLASQTITATEIAASTITPAQCDSVNTPYYATGSLASLFTITNTASVQFSTMSAIPPNINVNRPSLVAFSNGTLNLSSGGGGTFTIFLGIARTNGISVFVGYTNNFIFTLAAGGSLTLPMSMFSGFFIPANSGGSGGYVFYGEKSSASFTASVSAGTTMSVVQV